MQFTYLFPCTIQPEPTPIPNFPFIPILSLRHSLKSRTNMENREEEISSVIFNQTEAVVLKIKKEKFI
jgi:hypothetical protein